MERSIPVLLTGLWIRLKPESDIIVRFNAEGLPNRVCCALRKVRSARAILGSGLVLCTAKNETLPDCADAQNWAETARASAQSVGNVRRVAIVGDTARSDVDGKVL